MYERYYGLQERPFDLVPNPRFLYVSGRQREALGNLRYGLTSPRGLTLLLGNAGTGKTTLLQTTVAGLNGAGIKVVLLSNPTMSRAEFYEFLTEGFGLTPEARHSKPRFLAELRDQLQARAFRGEFSALVLDEAQSLSYELLEEVRLLSNIETPTQKLLNVVLAGQPELAERLNEPGLRQLKQRISLRCELTSLDLPETAAYVAGRLRIAGGSPAAIFSREAVLAIHEASAGVPRTINVVADNALIGGFALQQKPVSRQLVEEVMRDFDLAMSPKPSDGPVDPQPEVVVEAAADSSAPLFEMFNRKKRFSFF